MSDYPAEYAERVGMIVAAVAGAVIPLAFRRGVKMREAVTNSVAGALAATYIAPFVASYAATLPAFRSPEARSCLAFITGMLALRLCEAIWRVFDRRSEAAIERIAGAQIDRLAPPVPGTALPGGGVPARPAEGAEERDR